MSREETIQKLVTDWWEDDTSESGLANEAYDAGYRAAREDAATIADREGQSFAAEIRKLEPKEKTS